MTDIGIPSVMIPQGELTPVFPISDFVCFPKTFFPLYIFEMRYRRMIKDIQSSGYNKFVITSFMPNSSSSHLEEQKMNIQLYRIGVLCQILQIKTLNDGRSNIIVEGLERVEIKDFFRPYSIEGYAIGEVKLFKEKKYLFEDKEWEELSQKLYTLCGKSFEMVTGRTLAINKNNQLLEPEEVINTICQLLQVNIQVKFQLLTQDNILIRAYLLLNILQKNDND